MSAPLPDDVRLRPIEPRDDARVAAIIRQVLPEFGGSGPGYAIMDPEVDAMSAAYATPRARYLVVEVRGPDGRWTVEGGAGFGPLAGGDGATCELRKMYFLPALRGRGAGRALLERLLGLMREAGFRRCYLETLKHMTAARALYAALGFEPLCAPEGSTGHFGCDAWYALDLRAGRSE